MNSRLASNGFEAAVTAPNKVAAIRIDSRRIGHQTVLRKEIFDMPTSHPSPRVGEGNKSAAYEARVNHSRESHLIPQAPLDLAALAGEAANKLRTGNPSKKNRHLVFMSFIHEKGWRCSFCNADRTPISRRVVFRGADKVFETARRGNGISNEIDRLCFQQEIAIGKGGVWLELTEGQYTSLCRR
jgi:hypothetical protein